MKHIQPLTPAALYARVSSDRQDVDLSVAAQLRALRDYAKANGYSVAREYIDEAESGHVSDRPQFREMNEEGSSRRPRSRSSWSGSSHASQDTYLSIHLTYPVVSNSTAQEYRSFPLPLRRTRENDMRVLGMTDIVDDDQHQRMGSDGTPEDGSLTMLGAHAARFGCGRSD